MKLIEPFYIRQGSAVMSDDQRMAWFRECGAEAAKEGAQLGRYSISDDETLLLVEAWREKYVDDQGPIRWQLSPAQKGEA